MTERVADEVIGAGAGSMKGLCFQRFAADMHVEVSADV
jgi:hypothetical protein